MTKQELQTENERLRKESGLQMLTINALMGYMPLVTPIESRTTHHGRTADCPSPEGKSDIFPNGTCPGHPVPLKNPDVIRIGDFTEDGTKVTGRLLYPTRAHGGILLLTLKTGSQTPDYQVFYLDELYYKLRDGARTEYLSRLYELVGKAVVERNKRCDLSHVAS